MTYTILSAQWGNEDKSAVVAITREVAAVALSAVDTPEEWAAFQKWAQSNLVSALPVPVVVTLTPEQKLAKIGLTPAELKTLVV